MRWVFALCCACWAASSTMRGGDDVFDRVDDALTWSTPGGQYRARVSGLLDLEGYAFPRPAPAFIDSPGDALFAPRASLFFDAQAGEHLYAFAQGRADRGFDPSTDRVGARLDEYALRWAPGQAGRFSVQAGKFATVVGNWTARHDAWTNPFITAPLVYENVTGVWDSEPAQSSAQLRLWAHVRPGAPSSISDEEKYVRIPVVWGPSYATGVAVAGELERFRYAFELKNASLSSRPDAWTTNDSRWEHPTVSGRIRFTPNESWEWGWSASTGTYLRPRATPRLARSVGRGAYRETVFGQDVTYAWHHVQVWAELYAARFQVPSVGNAGVVAYYVETKYKFSAQWFGAIRWNQELFGRIPIRGGEARWGRDVWRVDLAPTYRFSAHAQMKFQYSVQRGNDGGNDLTHEIAGQATLRF